MSQGFEVSLDLLPSGRAEGGDLRRAEEVGDAELADAAPVVAVLGEGEPSEAVGDAGEDLRRGAVGEGKVVGLEEVLGGGSVGDDDGGDGADA